MQQSTKAAELLRKAFSRIDAEYGPHGAHPKPYHNLVHAQNVVTDADTLAIAGHSMHDRMLLSLAAGFHDVKHGLSSGANEKASAKIAFTEMKTAGFSASDCERVSELVLATTVIFSKDKVEQAVTDDPLSRILADADLASLGKKPLRYWINTLLLYREQFPDRPIERKPIAEFALGFISKHRFYTDEAKWLFPYQESNIKFLKSILAA